MTFTAHVQVRVGNDKGESKWKTMEVGHPVGALKNPSGKAALSVIDQHALGCSPLLDASEGFFSVYKTADGCSCCNKYVRIRARAKGKITHLTGCTTLLYAVLCPPEQHKFYLGDKRYCISRLAKE